MRIEDQRPERAGTPLQGCRYFNRFYYNACAVVIQLNFRVSRETFQKEAGRECFT